MPPIDKPLPTLPAAQGPIVDSSGLPTPEFYRWLRALIDWLKAVNAAIP